MEDCIDGVPCYCMFKCTKGTPELATRASANDLYYSDPYYSITINICPYKYLRINGERQQWGHFNRQQQEDYLKQRYTDFIREYRLDSLKQVFEICPKSSNVHLHGYFADPYEMFNVDTNYFKDLDMGAKYKTGNKTVYFERTKITSFPWLKYCDKDQESDPNNDDDMITPP